MSTLHLQLLGSPLVYRDDIEIHFPTRKTLALLIYLVMERGLHGRERLATLLWPESSRARANLRNTLNYLRTALADDQFLHVERQKLGLSEAATFQLDLDQIKDTHSADPTLLHLIRGEFLASFHLDDAPEFEAWVGQERTYWQQRVDVLFDHISAAQSQQGLASIAYETMTRWLAYNPLNEAAYRRLMRYHLLQNDRTAVLTTYEQCRNVLAAELGVAPAPETEALRHTANQWQTTIRADPATIATPLLTTPFAGRTAEFQALTTHYHYAAQAATRLVAVVGEAGIGKTRLGEEFGRCPGAVAGR